MSRFHLFAICCLFLGKLVAQDRQDSFDKSSDWIYAKEGGEMPILIANDPLKASPDLFYQLPVTHTEERIIHKIISALGEKNVFELLLQKRDLDRKGKRIHHVHPFRFLGVIYGDPELKAAMKEVKGNRFKWDHFLDGLGGRMDEERSSDNLIRYIPGFAKHTGADPLKILHYVQKGDWDALLKYLTG